MKVLCRRLSSKLGPVLTHEVATKEAGILTESERKEIANLHFFTQDSYDKPRSTTTSAKKEYLTKKLPIVKQIFGDDPENPGYLAYKLPKHMPNPYLDAQLRRVIDPVTGAEEDHGVPRLSVTKLLTKRWCELREAYDIYAKVPIFQHEQVLIGTAEHQKLEDEAHPISEDWHDFVSEFELIVPQDEFHELVESWFNSTVRLLSLFTKGESREVLCHGFVNSSTCELNEGGIKGEDDVLVSGVIDHLILRQRSSESHTPFALGNSVIEGHNLDLTDVLEQLSASRGMMRNNYEVVVSDVKTRSIRKIPSQNSVLKSTKLQVMYYRKFMETLGRDPLLTYEKLLLNAQRRGLDVDSQVDPAKVISMMAANNLLLYDLRRLKEGLPLNFEPYDNFYSSGSSFEEYDLSNYLDIITDVRVIEQFEEFFTQWARPVTLRYFAARLAQVYHQVGQLLSNSLMIEYYCRGDNFHNLTFDYDATVLTLEASESAKFWFGLREIEPVRPSIRNTLTHCRLCDYESVCAWKKRISENCRNLGKDLELGSQSTVL